ncbi:PLP-dependent aminotransferase family protein [Rhizobium sp. TRM96647]|uniref:MocR-like pyridoxine biosynthesis transcription factor PdxR n=1 Tax=unclassified Rhizobium TaxID=2613769 RepID=UPI0021E7C2A5|nr:MULTISPECIES: PLP-dependent aminotransferase family protein [unclassified Rhizobium]MCV3739251.1 PLP-dependent aminotransferase family protein [Rhizobium sp. TRM96647]MCV3760871.1 PLP-dependent aminotransferase family protein [Rhizobium sp. TRM96650]
MVKYAGGALIPPIRIDRDDPGSLTAQLASGLRELILSGRLAPGERLPSSRTLAKDQGVSRTTAVTVYEQLVAEELIYSRVGAGAYVSETLLSERPVQPQTVQEADDAAPPRLARLSIEASEHFFPRLSHPQVPRPFATGMPANDEFPMALWARLSAQYWRQSRHAVLGYPDPVGLYELRRAISNHLKANRGVVCDPDEVFVFNGAQDAFNRIGQMLLNPGDKVWFENPGPIGARNSLVSSGASLVPVPVDDQGIDVAAGMRLCPEFRMAFVTPARQHPLGVTMSLGRRLELLNAAAGCGAWVIEDDYDGEFYYSGHPAPTLKSVDTTGRVIYVGTFSKVMFAALRLGYVVAPPEVAKMLRRVAGATMQGAPSSLQSIMATFMEQGHFNAHLRRMRRVYNERQAVLVDAAARHLNGLLEVQPTTTGFQTIGHLPDDLDENEVTARALERGIILSPLSRFSLAPAQKGLILGFSAVPSRATVAAVQDLAELLRAMRKRQ